LEEDGDDLQEMNVKGWRQKVLDRKEWASVIKDLNFIFMVPCIVNLY